MAAVPNLVGGTATLTVDGQAYLLRGAFKYSAVTVKRETKSGQDKVHGFTEMPTPGMISGTLSDSGDLTVADFNSMRGVSISVELANGKTVIGSGMWTVDAQEVDSEEGTFDVKWEGVDGSVIEQLA
jgi:hypothetical protein